MRGKLKWFDPIKGYGFIVGDDNKEYMVHASVLRHWVNKHFTPGTEITFSTQPESHSRVGSVTMTLPQGQI